MMAFYMGNDILDDVLMKENYIFEREDAILEVYFNIQGLNIKVNTNFIE